MPPVDTYQPSELGRLPLKAPRTTSVNTWRWFLALEAVFALVYFPFGLPPHRPLIFGFLPWMEWPGQVFAWALLGLSAVVAIFYGVWRNRPRAPVGWWFLGGGVLLFITGDTTYKFWHQIMGQQNIPFPSFIDAIYITMYPVLAIGLLLLARARLPGGDRASLIDSVTITLGVGLLSWIFLIGPNVRAPGGMLVRLTAAAYPLGDILVLAMLAHLWSAGGLRLPAGRLLAIGALGTLVADSLYGLANLHPAWNWSDGNPIDLGWIVFYACWGAAALHPSMRALSEPRWTAPPRTTRTRLWMLATVSLIAPSVLLIETALGDSTDAPVIAVVAGVMFVLVLARMSGLVWDREQAEAREQALRISAADLAAAPGRDGIYAATMAGLATLTSGSGDLVDIVLAEVEAGGQLTVVGRSGDGSTQVPRNLYDIRTKDAERPTQKGVTSWTIERAPSSAARSEQSGRPEAIVCPIGPPDALQGLIIGSSDRRVPPELRKSIEALAAVVELALDREIMTEESHARRSEARFQTLVQNASDVILIIRPDTTITYQTPSVKRTLGYAHGSLEGSPLTQLLHPDDIEAALALIARIAVDEGSSQTAQWRVHHRNGSWIYVEVIAKYLLSDPTVEGIVLTLRDISERRGLEDELKHQAFHDALSGLANRALFRDRLEHALERAERSKATLAVLFLDLDDFKLINDSLGHSAGDTLLVEVADRITRALRGGDTAARFGGDEFAVLMEEITNTEEACEVANRILAALREPLHIVDREVQVRASIGIAINASGAELSAELIQAADVAMYSAKALGKGQFQVYKPALQTALVERLERTADLQRAVDKQEFEVHYQPILSLDCNEIEGLEALVRWRHPERGLVLPAEFISLAEETGLIVPIGRWVLHTACRQAREWKQRFRGAQVLRLSVNISIKHFQHDDFVQHVSMALEETGLDPKWLVLELTENVLVGEPELVIARMQELKQLGVSFAMDDFGTGYSSLSYLKRFPIDILKVDKAFVDDVVEDGALANTIIQLGTTLHLQTVAEGIEQARQIDELRRFGCQFGQGFYLARPLPPQEAAAFLSGTTSSGVAPNFGAVPDEETVG
ncbi:MAG TPA: EAL domain-containing protein [Acidimicrobiales bacterium]|nr:EAL domain-containing protein [Acidimicrobiales bacterium]